MAEQDFTGKVAIVTGASRGIGRAIARALADRGAAVAITARKLDSSTGRGGTLQETETMLEAAGARAIAVPADITQEAGARSVVDAAMEKFGRIDFLVNNAGMYPYATIVEQDPKEWHDMMAINVTAPFLMCQAALPVMIEQGSGHIFNVSSNSGSTYSEGHIAYATSKAGLNRFSMNLAEEVREHGIAVTSWSPGLIATDMSGWQGSDAEVVVNSVMWTLAQGPDTFTGQVVRRADFGDVWGPRG
jgi:NAD(P)-dependent dehydrogenase (short-subunit alcohol dehydrogenase family)